MATPNPLENTNSRLPSTSVSKKVYPIAGTFTTVYGLSELPAQCKDVACLWLLHPRLQTQEVMARVATEVITSWNNRVAEGRGGQHPKGLIAVAFDQRNHGSRKIDDRSNEAWRGGNPSHAQDMFSVYHGTAVDTSHLLSYLPAYIFPTAERCISTNLVLGISLGGHAAWHCLLHDERITAAVVIIGCPDYTRLMQHRAEKSKLKTWTETKPPGSKFIGSTDFPMGLVEAVHQWDPAGYLTGSVTNLDDPTHFDAAKVMPLLKRHLAGKKILNLSGGADKLVPYACGEAFLKFLKGAIQSSGGITLEDIVFDGVGHETTPRMLQEAVRFIGDTLAAEGSPSFVGSVKSSRL